MKRKAETVRAAANRLTKCVIHFENFISTLPGRVETVVYGDHPDADPNDQELFVAVYVKRDGADWKLQWSEYHEHFNGRESQPIEYKSLRDAPLKFKLAAVKLFPRVLESMEKSQDELAKEILDVANDYTNFASTLRSDNPSVIEAARDLEGFAGLLNAKYPEDAEPNKGLVITIDNVAVDMANKPALGRDIINASHRQGRRSIKRNSEQLNIKGDKEIIGNDVRIVGDNRVIGRKQEENK